MAFDNSTRNRLQRLVSDCRDLLTREFDAKLQELYGIYAGEGRVLDLAKLPHLDDEKLRVATLLRERIEHLASGGGGTPAAIGEAVKRVLREQAFTVLNRFAALRMAEERGIIVESVGGGLNSKGFKTFSEVAYSGLGTAYERYRVFLGCMFDELAVDLGVLFDRQSPFGLLFPRENVLLELFELFNAPEVKPLWREDETIGWVYQYFNDPAERKRMRDESAAPRNSRELAVRNQFFTPRYVVEFLTDNTLGRIWYEMTRGATKLKELCQYLVRRPNEIFLKEGEGSVFSGQCSVDSDPPRSEQCSVTSGQVEKGGGQKAEGGSAAAGDSRAPSQEELLKQPVFIPHRPIKDPRTILMLDPACGSMHFGLYAFDLFEVIYDEAWALEEKLGADALNRPPGMKSLHETYGTKEDFLKDVPRLIIEHNLQGIDIDPRCAQIAGLSLWLRAQKAWQRLGLKPAERPAIKRSNIVCAEPMPGEKELLREFGEREFPAEERGVFLRLLEAIFDKMQLAGEAGSLLKIEEEIRSAVADAKKLWKEGPQLEQSKLFAGLEPAKQKELKIDLSGITDEQFWDSAESRIYGALRDYAEQAENGGGFQRRLFAEDAARGFAFIDVCRKRYDVVVMNPPFGEAAISTRSYIADKYPESKDDIYAAFVVRMSNMLSAGLLGVISSRTGFFLTSMRRWRETTLLSEPSLRLVADLGDGVLDGALVEAAAYVVSPHAEASSTFFRLLDQDDKARPLSDGITSLAAGGVVRSCYVQTPRSFCDFPECRISYWALESIRCVFRNFGCASESKLNVQFGLSTKDDWRFLRLCWEIPSSEISSSQECCHPSQRWMYLAKGGEYALHFGDIHLVANWANRGREIGERVIQLYPYLNGDPNWVLHSEVPYGKPGVTYTNRTTSGFSPRVLPSGCLISSMGCTIFAEDDAKLPRVLATYASRAFGYLLEFNVASGDSVHSGSAARHYEIGTIASVPIPKIGDVSAQAGDDAIAIWKRKATADARDETSRFFLLPFRNKSGANLRACAVAMRTNDLTRFVEILTEASEAESAIRVLYNFDTAAREACDSEFGPDVTSYPRNLDENSKTMLPQMWNAGISEIVASTSSALGFARFISKMTFIADRRVELLCHRFHAHPQSIADALLKLPAAEEESSELAQASVAYALGAAFGRWDIRYAMGKQAAPELPDPFAPLPVCPPGQLQSADGLPVQRTEDGRLRTEGYPIEIPWEGILVDDPNHPLDIEGRVREVMAVIWDDHSDQCSVTSGQSRSDQCSVTSGQNKAEARGRKPEDGGLKATAESIEQEACEILGVKSLRDYFRKPAGFFADHLKRYSKSRRQAPNYWPLSTASGSYTLWIYYHRLTDQTLFQCVNDFVKPKITEVDGDLARCQRPEAGGQRTESREQRAELERLTTLRAELVEFRDELLRVAQLPYKPNLNDGVLITASPLWKLFRLPKWQKDLKACWESLEAGEYDWAHLALTLWPARVREVCRKDRSIAIAHGLEDLCEVKVVEKKAKRGKKRQSETDLELN